MNYIHQQHHSSRTVTTTTTTAKTKTTRTAQIANELNRIQLIFIAIPYAGDSPTRRLLVDYPNQYLYGNCHTSPSEELVALWLGTNSSGLSAIIYPNIHTIKYKRYRSHTHFRSPFRPK